MSREIVLVAGRDPLSEPGGGHSGYVRTHARAALAAGFRPHLFCVAPAAVRVETDFGVIHRVASPFRPFRQLMVAVQAPRLATAIEAFAATRKPRSSSTASVCGAMPACSRTNGWRAAA